MANPCGIQFYDKDWWEEDPKKRGQFSIKAKLYSHWGANIYDIFKQFQKVHGVYKKIRKEEIEVRKKQGFAQSFIMPADQVAWLYITISIPYNFMRQDYKMPFSPPVPTVGDLTKTTVLLFDFYQNSKDPKKLSMEERIEDENKINWDIYVYDTSAVKIFVESIGGQPWGKKTGIEERFLVHIHIEEQFPDISQYMGEHIT